MDKMSNKRKGILTAVIVLEVTFALWLVVYRLDLNQKLDKEVLSENAVTNSVELKEGVKNIYADTVKGGTKAD